MCIRDRFGTMEDVEELIREADIRGMGCMFDMVFNHTSTEHPWFKKACLLYTSEIQYPKDGEKDEAPFITPYTFVNADLRAAVFIGTYPDTAQGYEKVQHHIAADDKACLLYTSRCV